MTALFLKKGDRLPILTATLKGSDGSALDLTGATVKFQMRLRDSDTLKVNAACTVTDAEGGVVEYAWGTTDTNTSGKYLCEFEVTINGKVMTVPGLAATEIVITDRLV